MMEFILDYWFLIVAAAILLAAFLFNIKSIFEAPASERIAVFEEWLKYAVTEAEKELGSGTGQIKLRLVYSMALERFPWIERMMTFEDFSAYVDEALIWMRKQIEVNKDIRAYTEGGEKIVQVMP